MKSKKPKIIPPALDISSHYSSPIGNPLPSPNNLSWLTDLAIIATSPQSPLMQATYQNAAKNRGLQITT